MRVYELQPREGFDSIALVERPVVAPRPGEVRVRVRATSLNYRDLVVARGAKARPRPVVPLSDGAGEVTAVGDGVTHLRPGDCVVLLQGTGGVSIFALQLARAAGAGVIITSSSAEKRARASNLGAAHTIDYKADTTWEESARAFTGGRGVDVAVDVGGPGTFDQAVASLRYGGSLSILGILTGSRGEVNTYPVYQKTLRVNGIFVGSVAMFESLLRAIDRNRIEPVIDRTFDFGEARAAYEYLASGQHFGKIVIRV